MGLPYLTDAIINWHKSDLSNRVYCNLPDGKKKSIPRYYKNFIYTSEERGLLKGELQEKFRKMDEDLIRKGKVQTSRDREQAVLGAYRKMNLKDSKKII